MSMQDIITCPKCETKLDIYAETSVWTKVDAFTYHVDATCSNCGEITTITVVEPKEPNKEEEGE